MVVGQQVETFWIQFQPQIVRWDVTAIDAALEVKTGFSVLILSCLYFFGGFVLAEFQSPPHDLWFWNLCLTDSVGLMDSSPVAVTGCDHKETRPC